MPSGIPVVPWNLRPTAGETPLIGAVRPHHVDIIISSGFVTVGETVVYEINRSISESRARRTTERIQPLPS